jgi:hypothetical protein
MEKNYQPNAAKGGFALGKLIGLLFVAGLLGGGVWGVKYLLSRKESSPRKILDR